MRKSSIFYRLEKSIGDGYVSVFEFHTVINGNMYITEHEEFDNGQLGWIGPNKMTNKDSGNKKYLRLKAQGYKFVGKYEMDIYGHKEVLK
jgi:hypothetical protein